MFKNICLIGAGNIGSRHLQALAKVAIPLSIYVIDPSISSLELSKKRYEEIVNSKTKHKIHFYKDPQNLPSSINIAIIATNSNVRFNATRRLLSRSDVKYIIFEKILFDKKVQYEQITKLLSAKKIKAWVNCSMRTTPFYANLKKHFNNQAITYLVNGANHGLITNTVHYLDHMAYLTNCYEFEIDTTLLDKKPFESKREGFLELNGTLNAYFKDGSFGSFTCYSKGNSPFTIEIISEKYRLITSVLENKSLISSSSSNWKWEEKETLIAYQSDMTTIVVSNLLKLDKCDLPTFETSSKMHLNFLEPLLRFLNTSSKKFDNFPFT